jgi:hypothetical protein
VDVVGITLPPNWGVGVAELWKSCRPAGADGNLVGALAPSGHRPAFGADTLSATLL